MNENLIEAQYDITKKTKIKKFYEKNKSLIYTFIFFTIFALFGVIYYLENEENKRITLSDDYMRAQIYINEGEKNKAKILLEKIIFKNDPTYSSLSLFLLLNEDLVTDNNKINNFFNHLLKNNKFEKEMKNLIIFKKLLTQFDNLQESELLSISKPIISSDSVWKPHVLLLFGDYFMSKEEYVKASEFYEKILSTKGANQEFYDQAKLKLRKISNG
jgi:predicted negative regulator of RcsB-dependent stress response|tara:strand:+ start:3453 stop:4100 length:648 start_codon:yes stop_codon:yes gene_type:complete